MPKKETWGRAAIAVCLVLLTFLMTHDQPLKKDQLVPKHGKTSVSARSSSVPAIPKEVETIFVLVVGYYFAERKKIEPLRAARAGGGAATAAQTSDAFGELRVQFGFALALIAATIFLFFEVVDPVDGGVPGFRLAIETTWLAGVALGVAFFFKNTEEQDLDLELGWYRLVIALLMVLVVVAMYLWREKSIPVQWLTLVLVVVTFYFKERK